MTDSARVAAAYGRECLIETEGGELIRATTRGRSETPVCNDRVRYSRDGDAASVESVEPRERVFWRYDRRGGRRAIASHLDQLGLMIAAEPSADAWLIDRYIAAAEVCGLSVMLIWSKADLAGADMELLQTYQRLGYPLIEVSAHTGTGVKDLIDKLAGRVTLLTGLSGVGKSSLVNTLVPKAGARTAALSAASGEGTHTTTSSSVYPLADGTIIDTPGVREYYLWPMPPEELQRGYIEIAEVAGQCGFRNCTHQSEPRCAVKAAAEAGQIDSDRLQRFGRLSEGLARQYREYAV